MGISAQALTLRAKKLGVLIHDARTTRGVSLEACAQAIGVSATQLEAYEDGEAFPSLPEIELLAYTLNVPLDHFWGSQALSNGQEPQRTIDAARLMNLRHRMIGVTVRRARQQSGFPLEELAERLGCTPADLEAYEFGERPFPLPLLEACASLLQLPIKAVFDRKGPVGNHQAMQRSAQDFMSLPAELREFVAKPINRPYLELALRLSEMSVDKLRAVGEGILEITL